MKWDILKWDAGSLVVVYCSGHFLIPLLNQLKEVEKDGWFSNLGFKDDATAG